MNPLTIYNSKLCGTIELPVSKSEAHRAIICSSLAKMGNDSVRIEGAKELSDDIRITRQAIRDILSGKKEIFCGESGSTLRFLVPIAAALGRNVIFSGAGRLPYRPMKEYSDAFIDKGAELLFPTDDGVYLPLEIRGRLRPGIFAIPGNISSQYITGLLMALPLLEGDSEIILTTQLESSGYVDITLKVMNSFGIKVERIDDGYSIKGGQHYIDVNYSVEADYSAAAFWIAANYLGGNVELSNLPIESLQGDRRVSDIIEYFSELRKTKRACKANCTSPSLQIDVSGIPDLVPVLCVAAAATDAMIDFINASRLRLKESDRIASVISMINTIGGEAREIPEGIRVHGTEGAFRGGKVDTYSDHRIAMSAAIAGAFSINGVSIDDSGCAAKSYPGFFEDLIKVGGIVHGLSDR